MIMKFYDLNNNDVFKFDPSVSQLWQKINDGQIRNLQTGNITPILKGSVKVEKVISQHFETDKK